RRSREALPWTSQPSVGTGRVGLRVRRPGFDVGAEPLEVGDERDDLAVGFDLESGARPTAGDARGLLLERRAGFALEALRIGDAQPAERDDLALGVARVELALVQPRVGGHDRARRGRRRVLHVHEVPAVGILAADAVQIRAGALGAPQERVVVDELARLRVGAVALRLRPHRPDHLRVAPHAALADVDV